VGNQCEVMVSHCKYATQSMTLCFLSIKLCVFCPLIDRDGANGDQVFQCVHWKTGQGKWEGVEVSVCNSMVRFSRNRRHRVENSLSTEQYSLF
jgi:hypothetical protein